MKKIFLLVITAVLLNASGNVLAPKNNLYTKECASCHFAYPSGLLPSNSWQNLMSNLSNHYGGDASLDENDTKSIRDFLVKNSASNSNSKLSNKIVKSMKNKNYQSLSEIPYLKKKHKELKKEMINQKEVRTLANCASCHKDAKDGIFDEDNVFIPNYGKYND